jgi:hypothetical protein
MPILGEWGITQRPATWDLVKMPAGCAREILAFEYIRTVSYPGRAILEARIVAEKTTDGGYAEPAELTGLKFPDDTCDAEFSSCAAPW